LAALDARLRTAQDGNPLAPVTVVVPSNAVAVAARRALARRRPMGNVEFLTLWRLAERLGRSHLAGRRPLSTPLLDAALTATLRDRTGPLHAVASHAATVTALREAYRAVRQLPAPLAARVGRHGSPLGQETVAVCHATHRAVARSWFDQRDVADAALKALKALTALDDLAVLAGPADPGAPSAAPALPPVLVYLPEWDDPAAAELVDALAVHTPVLVLAALTGDPSADDELTTWIGRLAVTAGHQPAPPGARAHSPSSPTHHVHVVSTSDPDDEVRAAVRHVVEATRRGIPLHRMIVVWATQEPYARLVTDRFTAAGLPIYGTDAVPVAERTAGRCLLGLLDVDRRDWRRADVFALLATGPFHLPSGTAVPVAAWERLSRDAHVYGGSQWNTHLVRHAEQVTARALAAGFLAADTPHPITARALALQGFIATLADDLASRHETRRWAWWAERAHRLTARYLPSVFDSRARNVDFDPDPVVRAERRAAERVQAAIDRLADLDAVAAAITRAEFHDALAAELGGDLGRAGSAGTGLHVGPLGAIVGADADVVIVVGAGDQALPGAPGVDPLFSAADRAAAGGLLAHPERSAERRRRGLALAMTSSPEVVVTAPRGSLRQTAAHRLSPWVGELADPATTHHLEIASFSTGIAWSSFPATTQEHRTRALTRHVRAGLSVETHTLATADPVLRSNLRLLQARRSSLFTEYDGNLAGVGPLTVVDLDRPLAATRAEKWAGCPFRWFVEELLHVRAVENPEDAYTMTALDRGTLVHAVIDRFQREVLAGVLPQPEPTTPWSALHHSRLLELLDEAAAQAEQAGLTGRSPLWRRTRRALAVTLGRWLRRDDQARALGGYRLTASESSFGFANPGPNSPAGPIGSSDWPAARVELPDGRMVAFRGTIDRVDVAADGTYRVVDHKTGGKYRFTKLEESVHEGGTKLQLLVYAAAVRAKVGHTDAPVRAEYVFLDEGSGAAIVGYHVDEAKQVALGEAVGAIVTGIEQGVFVAYPPAPGWHRFVECPCCDPDGLGTASRHGQWMAKRADPALAGFVALREPEP
jgi:ATP-dependent helicase/nuclease subunit B